MWHSNGLQIAAEFICFVTTKCGHGCISAVCDGQHILLPVFLIYIDFDWLTAALVFYGGQTCGVDASYAPLK